MSHEILELLAEKKYSAVEQLVAQMEEADLAKLFEELEIEEECPLPPGTRVTVEMGAAETGKYFRKCVLTFCKTVLVI